MENGYVEIKLTDMPHAFDCVCRLKAERSVLKIQNIISDFRVGLIGCNKKHHILQTMSDSEMKYHI
jgi:hypothetical protein